MSSPDWEVLADKYLYPYITDNYKDYTDLFGRQDKNIIHNDAFNMLIDNYKEKQRKSKKPIDYRRYGIVKHSQEMLPYIQEKLIDEGKVIKYYIGGKEIVRNNNKWTKEEKIQFKNLRDEGRSAKSISKVMGRSRGSIQTRINKGR